MWAISYPVVFLVGFLFLEMMMPSSSLAAFCRRSILNAFEDEDAAAGAEGGAGAGAGLLLFLLARAGPGVWQLADVAGF